jgi:hypothetical protein
MIRAAILTLFALCSFALAHDVLTPSQTDCLALEGPVQETLGVPVTISEVPFEDYVTGLQGNACEIRAHGTGEDFAHFAEGAADLQRLLEERGWQSDTRYAADGPTGTVIGLRQDERVAVVGVSWEPADPALCPDDEPIFLCNVAPEEQLYTVTLTLAEEPQAEASNLERLALRLLGPWGDPGRMTTALHPGRLPQELPFELPLADEMEILGSLVRRGEDEELLNVQVVLDAATTTEEAMAALQSRLQGAGWTGRREPQPGGFVPVQPSLSGVFCAPEDAAFMYVNSFFVASGPTDVRLDINLEAGYTPCPGIAEMPFDPYTDQAPLPTLSAPEESELFVYGFSMEREAAASSARVLAGLSGEALLHHYETQLEAARWERLEGEAIGPVSYSRFGYEDEEGGSWLAVLTVTMVAKGEHLANIAVVLAE